MTPELASLFAAVALANVQREYPRKIDYLLVGAPGELRPRLVHPVFYGSYDWHSAVHMHWLLARLLRRYPQIAEKRQIQAIFDRHLTPANAQEELAFFNRPGGAAFERPYGWAWLLALQAELLRTGHARWANALAPLARELAQRMQSFIEGAPYPIRAGTHGNTAFACILALDYARATENAEFSAAIGRSARRWYGGDRDAPLAYEPSLDDFLSPSLVEAVLMQEVLPAAEFAAWRQGFLSRDPGGMIPPFVRDRTDAKQSHLDGLALSRAWCFRRLGHHAAAERHLAAALPHVVGGDYVGEHWLASFALLALSEAGPSCP